MTTSFQMQGPIILKEESQEISLSRLRFLSVSRFLQHRAQQRGELHELTHFPLRSRCEFFCKRAKGLHGQHKHQSRKKSSVTQLDHSFYKGPGSVHNKVLTFIATSTSMCGAATVPDLSTNQVGFEALKQLIMVNGFTHSVLQCDGLSGLMKLQDQVGKDLSLPTQISPHTHIKVTELLKDFARLLMVRSGQSNLDSLLILEFILIQQQHVSYHGLFNMLSSPSTGTSFVRMARHHTRGCSTRLIQLLWFISGKESTGLKLQALSEDQTAQCDRVILQKFRSPVGKLLWMAQLRDDLKYPVKKLSRSLINPPDQNIKNLIRLLKHVNQTRDFIFVMEPQLLVRNQEGRFPVQIVSYSDSDGAGCQKSRKSTSGLSSINKQNSGFNCSFFSRK